MSWLYLTHDLPYSLGFTLLSTLLQPCTRLLFCPNVGKLKVVMCLLIRIIICRILVGTTLVLDLHELVSKVLLLKSNASSTMHRFLEPPVYFGPIERPWYNCLVKIVSCNLSSCPILNRHIVSACVYSAVFEYSM